jgi:hypothetical protein
VWINNSAQIEVASWCVMCYRPEIYGNNLKYNLNCSRCPSSIIRFGTCLRLQCQQKQRDFDVFPKSDQRILCRNCELFFNGDQQHFWKTIYEEPQHERNGKSFLIYEKMKMYKDDRSLVEQTLINEYMNAHK